MSALRAGCPQHLHRQVHADHRAGAAAEPAEEGVRAATDVHDRAGASGESVGGQTGHVDRWVLVAVEPAAGPQPGGVGELLPHGVAEPARHRRRGGRRGHVGSHPLTLPVCAAARSRSSANA